MTFDLIGQRFGRLVVVAAAPAISRNNVWWCQCDCGERKSIRTGALRSGRVHSCGCLRRQMLSAMNKRHGQATHRARSRLYKAWCAMKTRCLNPKYGGFKNYGGRGIGIAPEWLNDFSRFAQDVGEPPFPKATLDRVDNDGDYRPGNVRWATRAEQNRNQRQHQRARPYQRGGRTIIPSRP